MDIEALWYEAFPWLYVIGGFVAFFVDAGSILLRLSGGLLIVAAITVLRLRWVYRRALFMGLPTPASLFAARARSSANRPTPSGHRSRVT